MTPDSTVKVLHSLKLKISNHAGEHDQQVLKNKSIVSGLRLLTLLLYAHTQTYIKTCTQHNPKRFFSKSVKIYLILPPTGTKSRHYCNQEIIHFSQILGHQKDNIYKRIKVYVQEKDVVT